MKISFYNIEKEFNDNILIYNTFSKASIFLEKGSDTSCFHDIESFKKMSKKEQKLLIDNGFVVDDDRDEFLELKYIFEQKFFDTENINIILVPSLLCNFNCPYCFEKNYNYDDSAIKKYFKTLQLYAEKNFKNHKNVQISLFGGEPLLYAKQFLQFLGWVEEDSKVNGYSYFTTLTTNGSLLTQKILEDLLKHNLYSIQITIDSDKEIHDRLRTFKDGQPSFDLLIKKINDFTPILKQHKETNFVVRINLNNTTPERVKKSLENIKVENRPYINLLIRAIYKTHAYKDDNTNSTNSLQEYFDIASSMGFVVLKDKYYFQTCEACGDRKNFYLMPDLSMRKCANDLSNDKVCIGKLDENGNPILNVENIVNWYKTCTEPFINPKCIKCKQLPDCLGGCPLYRLKNNKCSCRSFDMSSLPFIY